MRVYVCKYLLSFIYQKKTIYIDLFLFFFFIFLDKN